MSKYFWVYLPEIDEAGCVVMAASFEDAFQEGCDCLNPEDGVEVQIHELGESRTFHMSEVVMPSFRVTGHVCINFIHDVKASSAEEAEKRVEGMRVADFDTCNLSEGENTIYNVVPLDADGDEVNDE